MKKATHSYLVMFLLMAIVSCGQQPKNQQKPKPVFRDTSISILNAYSPIFLDSLAVEDFISKEVKIDTMAGYLRNFYGARNYSFAWFDENGLTQQAEGFWNMHTKVLKISSDSSIYEKKLHRVIDTLLDNDTVSLLSKSDVMINELRFTQHFFQYVRHAYSGKIDPVKFQWHIPRKKLKPFALLDSFLNNAGEDLKIFGQSYHLLQQQLFKYKNIELGGGWSSIAMSGKNLKIGDSDTVIAQVKKRLQITGFYEGGDSSVAYSAALQVAVKKIKKAFGLTENGIIDDNLIEQLNVSVNERIKQILVNLERMKWLPQLPPKYLMANIPEYKLHAMENGKEIVGMNIVVGKAANRTVIFADELKYVVFSPYWNIPRSIVRNEIYPSMKRSRSYLKRHNMEITGYSRGLPIIRQKPGKGNALGQVKFIFPNSYNIYFHDTPSKNLFDKEKRAFSHGCIRLHDPFRLAAYILKDKPDWTEKEIRQSMNSSREKWVSVDPAIPVFITYLTSWVDSEGILHFVDDIYGHDRILAQHLFE